MEKEFIPHEQALKLNQLGFDEPCFAYWNIDPYFKTPFLNIAKPFNHEWCLPSPTFSQAFRWFREKHLLDGLILPQTYSSLDPLPIYFLAIESYKDSIWTEPFNSTSPQTLLHYSEYEEAELACLDKLIEIVGSDNG
jgi:hypothetical protein